MAINLGEAIFKSGYSKLALLYPWRPGNVNVFSLWTDGRNACCLKFSHQRSRTHPPLVSNIQHADSSSRLPWSCFDTPVKLFKLLQHCEANELWRLQSLRKDFSPPQRTNAAANVPLSLEMQPWCGEGCAGENSSGIISTSRQEFLRQRWCYRPSPVLNRLSFFFCHCHQWQAISNFRAVIKDGSELPWYLPASHGSRAPLEQTGSWLITAAYLCGKSPKKQIL